MPVDSQRQVDKRENIKICFKFQFKGATGEFSPTNNPNNNFSTVRPIFTCNIPIDSVGQAKDY
jgi:hypothetical protein